MKNVMFCDVIPYICIWTGIFIIYLVVAAIRLARFAKRYPGIKENDPQKITPEIQEAKRQYSNRSVIAFSMIFLWSIGIVVICCIPPTSATKTWPLLVVLLAMMMFVLSSFQRKK